MEAAKSGGLMERYREMYPLGKYNWLLPSVITTETGYAQEIRAEVVTIDADARNGECFPVAGSQDAKSGEYTSGAKLTIGKPGLEKLKYAAGISLKTDMTVRTAKTVMIECIGMIRKPDGTYEFETRRKEIDLDAKREALMLQWQKKLQREKAFRAQKKWKPIEDEEIWVKDNVHRELVAIRETMVQRAETGASNRTIRAMLGLKAMPPAELKKPFVVFRVDFAPPLNDALARQYALTQGASALAAMYGARAVMQALPAETVAARVTVEPVEPEAEENGEMEVVLEKEPEDTTGAVAPETVSPDPEEMPWERVERERGIRQPEMELEEQAGEPAEGDGGGEMTPEEERTFEMMEWSEGRRIRHALELAEEKGQKMTVRLKGLSPAAQVAWIEKLANL